MAQDRRMEVLHRKIKRLESEAELLETTSSSFGKEKGKDAILFLPTENFQPTSDKDEKVRRRLAEVHKAISQAREEMSLSQVKEAMQRPLWVHAASSFYYQIISTICLRIEIQFLNQPRTCEDISLPVLCRNILTGSR